MVDNVNTVNKILDLF